MFDDPTTLAIAGLVLFFLILVIAVVTRYKVAGPHEAFIVTGKRGKTATDLSGQKVVTGGGVFVIPFVQQLAVLDLSSRRISVQIRGAVSKQGIKLNLDGIAIVKVGGDDNAIRAAAQRFLSQQNEIETFTTEVLAGALRSIVGTLSVEEIIRDRASFAAQVAEVTESALTGQGLVLDTFQIQDVTDDGTYLADLGRPEAARVKQDAAIAEADAHRMSEQRRIAAEQQVLDSQREYALRQSEIKIETDAAAARAAAAGPLAEAAQQQEILKQQELVAVQRAALTERELDTQVRKPADANRYKVEQEAEASRTAAVVTADAQRQATIANAEARKQATIAAAQADAEQSKLTGEGERARRAALAEATRLEGEAQAAATLATGKAEAEAMESRAEAFARYNEAAVVQMLVEALPEIAKQLASPMGAIDSLTVISTDGAGALPKQVTSNMTQLQQLLKDTLGIDMTDLLTKFASSAPGNGDATAVPIVTAPRRATATVVEDDNS